MVVCATYLSKRHLALVAETCLSKRHLALVAETSLSKRHLVLVDLFFFKIGAEFSPRAFCEFMERLPRKRERGHE